MMHKIARPLLQAAFILCACIQLQAQDMTGPYEFRAVYLIKGKTAPKESVPERAVRNVKSYPLKVREYTFPAAGMDYTAGPFPELADKVIAGLAPAQRSNAVAVAKAVADFTANSIQAREAACVPSSDPHLPPLTALQVLKAGAATGLEKCRLACALLRYFSIPARTAWWNDSYVVEYYLKPENAPKIEPAWHVMDPSGRYEAAGEKAEPVAWHPVRAAELLDVEWKGASVCVEAARVRNFYPEGSEAEILADYDNLCEKKAGELPSKAPAGSFYLIKAVDYRISYAAGVTEAALELTMPFNENKPFKTVKFFVSALSKGIETNYKRSHTFINPPNSGLVYTLPVRIMTTGQAGEPEQ